jgi:membrane-associated phospholipid phosphatase
MFRFISDLDTHISARLAICSAATNLLQKLLRWFFILIEYTGHGLVWILLPLFLYSKTSSQGGRFVLAELFIGIIVDLIIQTILKVIFRRQRPLYNEGGSRLTVASIDAWSFPSGHATRFGFLVTFVRFYFPGTVERTVLYVWTSLIVLSRLLLGRHYLSDVICGLGLGYLNFSLVHLFAKHLINPFR